MTAIILINPQMGENIGAAARAMLNFGLTDLRIVKPRDGWPNEAAIIMSAGAKKVIENAKTFESTNAAIADLEYVYATTARARELDKKVITPSEIVSRKNIGILFGGERSGLNNDDIALANEIISFPVSSEYGSINLSMAVGIICYELSQEENHNNERELANKKDMGALFEYLERELENANFFSVDEKKPGMLRNIKTMFSRAEFSPQELRTFRGILKALKK